MQDNKLEVGDVVYVWHHSYPSYLTKHKVVRLTPKRAVIDSNTQVSLELQDGWNGKGLMARGIGGANDAYLETSELISQYREQGIRNKAIKALCSINIKELPLYKCEALIDMFPLIEPVKTDNT